MHKSTQYEVIDDNTEIQNNNNTSNKQVSDTNKKTNIKEGNTPTPGVKPSGALGGINSGMSAEKISKKDKMHEV